MSKKLPRGQIIELGGEPRINFLPGEIQERKDARRRRRSLFMLVILVGVLCAIGYFYAAQYATQRQAALEAEQEITLEILAQQSQFVDARNLATEVETIGKGITHITRNEVKWRDLVVSMRSELPAGAQLRQWTFAGPTSQEVADVSNDIFQFEVGGLVGLDLIVDRVSTIGEAIERLSAMPGVLAVSVNSTSLLDDQPGYGTVLAVIVSDELYEGRFRDGWQPGMTPISESPALPGPSPESPDDDPSDTDDDAEEDQ